LVKAGTSLQSSLPAFSACLFSLPFQPAFSACLFSLPFQPAFSACLFSLPFQPALFVPATKSPVLLKWIFFAM
jgi:hypothetical protein